MAAASAAPAMARVVVSDTVAFKGTVNPFGEYGSVPCSLKSDTEKTAVPCQVEGTAHGIGSGAIDVSSRWLSSDGEGFFPPLAAHRSSTSKPPNEIYEGTGPCEEREESDGPPPIGPVTYPCTVTVRLIFNTKKTPSPSPANTRCARNPPNREVVGHRAE
jgi:hypothetical protein